MCFKHNDDKEQILSQTQLVFFLVVAGFGLNKSTIGPYKKYTAGVMQFILFRKYTAGIMQFILFRKYTAGIMQIIFFRKYTAGIMQFILFRKYTAGTM